MSYYKDIKSEYNYCMRYDRDIRIEIYVMIKIEEKGILI